ncbi:hypothetical protein BDP27DRAFT_1413401 [Rhodocollybia butyracea]|uniref:Uncharacterized protein n=1 Tax=Rhodocollybia butyracea TaxID=206335 RepID=A0A9P5Q410_9AGAR|nr:hypothetical protein BDP27DRAFT_1413401 [Rhodocollybia butyracea]
MPHDAPKIYGPTGDDNTGISSLAAKAATGHYDSKRNEALGDARAQSAKDGTGDEPALERQNSETNATQVGAASKPEQEP